MTTDPDFDLALWYLEDFPEPPLKTLLEDLKPLPVRLHLEPRENTPQAAVEWLIPTAFVIFITHNFFGPMLKEAAKDHYPIVKAALLRFIGRTVGKDREVTFQYIASSPKKLSAERPAAFSIYATLSSGQRVKFAFDDTMDSPCHTQALDDLLASLERHFSSSGQDTLGNAVSPVRAGTLVVMRFDQRTGHWIPWDPLRDPPHTQQSAS